MPYLILNTFWIAFYFCTQHVSALSPFFSKPENIVANWNLTRWFEAYFSNTHITLSTTWFMRDLFVLNLFAIVIVKIVDEFPKFSLAVLLVMWLCVPGDLYKSSYWELQAICFWGLGCLFVRQRIRLDVVDKIPAVVHVLVYVALVAADVSLRHSIIHRLCVIYGIVFWYSCMTSFKAGGLKNFLLKFSAFNFCIYIFHENTLECVRKLFTRFIPLLRYISCACMFLSR